MYLYLCVSMQKERQSHRERERAQKKTNRKEVRFNFHTKKQNLEHLCYEILNFTFHAK